MSFTSDIPLQVNQLSLSIDFPKDFDKFLEVMALTYKKMVQVINTKEGGLYSLQELYNSNQYFTLGNPQRFRNVYRKTFDLVALNGGNIAGGAVVAFPHNITGLSSATLIYASCTSVTPQYFTVVYPNAFMDAVNINFINPLPATALSAAYFIAEYLKS